MLLELLRAFGFIFLAEMGDKTQILAMTFATKYKVRQVVLGIFIGSLLNHALAIILGANLHHIIPINTLSIIAGFSFIGFGLWSFLFDDSKEEDKESKKGPVITVALAFFIGELGDKTQLTATILSTEAQYPVFILMGTVLGMVVTGLIGIYVGIKLGSKIDDFIIKIGAGFIFVSVGYIKLFEVLFPSWETVYIVLFSVLIVISVSFLVFRAFQYRRNNISLYKQVAQRLKDYYSDMYEDIEGICLGQNHCGSCGGNQCLVGYTKNILLNASLEKDFDYDFIVENALTKKFERKKVLESYIKTVEFLAVDFSNQANNKVHEVRHNLELILYLQEINEDTYEDYLNKLKTIDYKLFEQMKK